MESVNFFPVSLSLALNIFIIRWILNRFKVIKDVYSCRKKLKEITLSVMKCYRKTFISITIMKNMSDQSLINVYILQIWGSTMVRATLFEVALDRITCCVFCFFLIIYMFFRCLDKHRLCKNPMCCWILQIFFKASRYLAL